MNLNDNNQLKYEVMSRVKNVRGVRLFTSSPIASGMLAAAFIFFSSIMVSLRDIMINTMNHPAWSERFSYASSSLFHSSILVQIDAALIMLACLMALVNSMRKFVPRFYTVSLAVVSRASFSSRFVFGKFFRF